MAVYVPTVDISLLVRRPPIEVWEAFADPEQIRRFWLADSTVRLVDGATAHWRFKVKGSEVDVEVIESVPGELLLLSWDEGQLLRIEFGDRGEATLVRVFLDKFEGDDAAGQAIDAMSGFTLVLASLKMYLEHGIEGDLMYDRFPDHEYHDR